MDISNPEPRTFDGGAARPFVPGLLELSAMVAIKGDDGVWSV